MKSRRRGKLKKVNSDGTAILIANRITESILRPTGLGHEEETTVRSLSKGPSATVGTQGIFGMVLVGENTPKGSLIRKDQEFSKSLSQDQSGEDIISIVKK